MTRATPLAVASQLPPGHSTRNINYSSAKDEYSTGFVPITGCEVSATIVARLERCRGFSRRSLPVAVLISLVRTRRGTIQYRDGDGAAVEVAITPGAPSIWNRSHALANAKLVRWRSKHSPNSWKG